MATRGAHKRKADAMAAPIEAVFINGTELVQCAANPPDWTLKVDTKNHRVGNRFTYIYVAQAPTRKEVTAQGQPKLVSNTYAILPDGNGVQMSCWEPTLIGTLDNAHDASKFVLPVRLHHVLFVIRLPNVLIAQKLAKRIMPNAANVLYNTMGNTD